MSRKVLVIWPLGTRTVGGAGTILLVPPGERGKNNFGICFSLALLLVLLLVHPVIPFPRGERRPIVALAYKYRWHEYRWHEYRWR